MLYRNTKQKEKILNLLIEHGHLTTSQIIGQLKNENISLATIYRNLNILLKEGKLRIVKVNDVDVYEPSRNGHFHFKCRICQNVLDVEKEKVKINIDSSLKKCVKEVELIMIGICPKCQKKIEGD